MEAARDTLLANLSGARRHVLAAADGLDEADLARPLVPSGWTIAALLSHLALDDEMFWIGAVLGGDPDAIADLTDGWSTGWTGAAAIERYRAEIERSDRILATADLDRPPAWTPPPEVFPFPPFEASWQVVDHLLVETATHAGHLDIVRELIDGRQYLVL